MICPYRDRSETTYQGWTQNPNDENIITNGQNVTQTIYEPMKCPKEECGAWHDGRCCYNG